MARLSDITVLAVGPSGALLHALTGRLVAEGARVVLAHPPGTDEVSPESPRVHRRSLDVTDADAWTSLAASIQEDFGELHGLVHATGPGVVGPLAEMAVDAVRDTIDVNLLGPALGIRTCAALLAASGGGSIVTIASTEALRGARNAAVHSATNWGLRGLTRSAALELGSLGIRVNTVCPSIGLMADGASSAALADGEQARGVTMGDVASMVAFLLSDDSATCTGGDFLVDAGATA